MLIDRRDCPAIRRKKIALGHGIFLPEDTEIYLDVKRGRDDLSLELKLVFRKTETYEDHTVDLLEILEVKNLPRGGPDFSMLAAKYNRKIEEAVDLSLLELATKAVNKLEIFFTRGYLLGSTPKEMPVCLRLRIRNEYFNASCSANKLIGFLVF
ncbi:MAG: hypothetical protein Q8Q90_02345 [bacterium]|nr:hypothetical protein [bacterium]